MNDQTRTKTATGRCPEHGVVRAVKEVPRPKWPFLLYLWRLGTSSRAPFLCPTCGQAVSRD
jgi:hypothetical protein